MTNTPFCTSETPAQAVFMAWVDDVGINRIGHLANSIDTAEIWKSFYSWRLREFRRTGEAKDLREAWMDWIGKLHNISSAVYH